MKQTKHLAIKQKRISKNLPSHQKVHMPNVIDRCIFLAKQSSVQQLLTSQQDSSNYKLNWITLVSFLYCPQYNLPLKLTAQVVSSLHSKTS